MTLLPIEHDINRIRHETVETKTACIFYYSNNVAMIIGKNERGYSTSPTAHDVAKFIAALKDDGYTIDNILRMPLNPNDVIEAVIVDFHREE